MTSVSPVLLQSTVSVVWKVSVAQMVCTDRDNEAKDNDASVTQQVVSFVVPCFNEAEMVPIFFKEAARISDVLINKYFIKTEFVFVDDGSTDETLSLIRDLANKDKRVKYIAFSRNFGKESAILAGLSRATGDYVATLDADLQDPPSLLPKMFDYILSDNSSERYECIGTYRETRAGEPPIRSFFAHLFYKLINKMSETKIVDGARDFRLMTRKFVNAVLELGEYNRFSKGIFSWVGFKTKWIPYQNVERVAGKTKWSFWKLLQYSIQGIVSFSTTPLVVAVFTGMLFCLLSILGIAFVIIRAAIYGDPVAGWPSTVSVILLIGGIQLFGVGILGEYISKIYLESKRRPLYIVRETENDL